MEILWQIKKQNSWSDNVYQRHCESFSSYPNNTFKVYSYVRTCVDDSCVKIWSLSTNITVKFHRQYTNNISLLLCTVESDLIWEHNNSKRKELLFGIYYIMGMKKTCISTVIEIKLMWLSIYKGPFIIIIHLFFLNCEIFKCETRVSYHHKKKVFQ